MKTIGPVIYSLQPSISIANRSYMLCTRAYPTLTNSTKKAAHKRGIPAHVQLLLILNPRPKSFHHTQSSQLHKQTTH